MRTEILITGASGFVGGKILEALAGPESLSLSVLLRRGSRLKKSTPGNIRIYEGDITEPGGLKDAVSGKNIIIHCAALMSDSDSENRKKFYEVNVAGTLNLLRSRDEKTLKHFIHISTAGVYGAGKNRVFTEEAPYGRKLSAYEWSKKEAELAVLKYAGHKNIPFTILRPSQLYGAGMRYGWPDTFRAIKSGRMRIPGNGKTRIHLLNVRDFAEGVKSVLENTRAVNKIYNMAGPEVLSISEVFDAASGIMGAGKAAKVPYLPVYLASVFLSAVPAYLKSAELTLLTPHRVKFFSTDHAYDISRAKTELNYNPRVKLKEGFAEMLQWCQKEGLI